MIPRVTVAAAAQVVMPQAGVVVSANAEVVPAVTEEPPQARPMAQAIQVVVPVPEMMIAEPVAVEGVAVEVAVPKLQVRSPERKEEPLARSIVVEPVMPVGKAMDAAVAVMKSVVIVTLAVPLGHAPGPPTAVTIARKRHACRQQGQYQQCGDQRLHCFLLRISEARSVGRLYSIVERTSSVFAANPVFFAGCV